MIRADNASYLPNSVVIGMQEGYYVDTEVGGYPSPKRPSFHKIMDFLPPQSLIEVKKTEVSVCVCVPDVCIVRVVIAFPTHTMACIVCLYQQ